MKMKRNSRVGEVLIIDTSVTYNTYGNIYIYARKIFAGLMNFDSSKWTIH